MPPFRLVPFAVEPPASRLSLTGSVERDAAALRAAYLLAGDLSTIVVAAPSSEPTRRDGLWRTTCFELFAAPHEQASYLEINLSPSGDWQAYSFSAYRGEMAPLAVAGFTSRCHVTASALEIDFEVRFDPSTPLPSALDVGVTAVIEHGSGTKSYFALTHTSERPDFHKRDSFTLRV